MMDVRLNSLGKMLEYLAEEQINILSEQTAVSISPSSVRGAPRVMSVSSLFAFLIAANFG